MKTIVITGGTGKFGFELVRYFSKKCWTVIFTATSNASCQKLLDSIDVDKKFLFPFVVDFQSSENIKNFVSELVSHSLYPDYLINNARSLSNLKIESDGMTSRENFLKEFEIDVIAPYELTVGLARLDRGKLKSVVNIGSQYGIVAPNPNLYSDYERQSPIQYGVAKAALSHLTKELAVRLSSIGVRVNCVAFGGVEGRVDDYFKSRYCQMVPMGRMLFEREIPGPIDFLLSEASSSITGQTISADGGWGIW